MSRMRNNVIRNRILVALSLLVAVVCVVGFANAMRPDEAEVRQKNWPAPYEVARTVSDTQDEDPVIEDEKGGVSDSSTLHAELPAETEIVRQKNGSAYCANRVLLSFDGTMDSDELTSRLEKDGVEVEAVEVVSNALDNNGVLVRVTYRGDQVPADLAEELQKLDYIETAEPDYIQSLCETGDQLDVTPNDARFSSQWGLTAIGAPTAWDTRKSEGAVTVAVIDSGVEYSHPDLANNLVSPSYAYNACINTYGASAVNDTNGHGTHVAGIIAAESGNATGVSGVSYNAKVLPIMVLDSDGESVYSSEVIEAIDYVISCKTSESSASELKNIRVINLSLGGYERSTTYASAIKRAHDAGILVVCAGGNESTSGAHYPAAYPYAVGVSALKKTSSGVTFDSGYSNFGSYIDLSAPGTSILSTVPGGKYSNMSGTSMATPMVSGAAALVFAGNMDLSPDDVEQILKEKSDDLGSVGWDRYYGAGAVRLDNAVAVRHLSQATIEPVPDQLLNDGGVTPALTVTYGSTTLEPDVDYTVAYADNTSAGTATATVTGKGNYVGSKSTTFTVVGKDLSSATIGDIPQQVYTGSELKPTAEVILDGVSLVEGSDYTLSYRNNVRWGTGTLVVTGKGNYTGTVSKDFDIIAAVIDIPDPEKSLVYNGEEQYILPESEWYTFEGDISGTNAGTYTVRVTLGERVYWSDGSTDPRVIEWRIARKEVQIPEAKTEVLFTGEQQQGVLDGDGYTLSGNVSATEVGDYSVTAKLRPVNYVWSDGTTRAIEIPWTIEPARPVEVPTAIEGLVYNSGEQHGVPEAAGYTLTGATAVNAGSYTATAELVPGYYWADGSAGTKTISWSIGRMPIEYPPNQEDVYSGEAQSFAAGEYTQARSSQSGELFLWGDNTSGRLGDGTTTPRPSPVKVMSGVRQVALGHFHSACVTESGELYLWGYNDSGQIGDGSYRTAERTEPVKVMSSVRQVALGGYHSACVTESGDLYLWGEDLYGQIGDGTVTEFWPSPIKVMSGVRQVALGGEHSACVTESGDLYLWGRNESGQIGDGTTTSRPSPVKVMSGVRQVALGGEHSACVTESGDLYLWGRNDVGQIGDGGTSDQWTPTKQMSGVRQVALGDFHSACVTESGDLYLWGYNGSGRLGDGTTTSRPSPVKVMSGVRQVALGFYHSACVTDSGDLYLWGQNDSGQIGDGTTVFRPSPVKIMPGALQVALGYQHSACVTYGEVEGRTASGNSTVTVFPDDNHCWSDGSTGGYDVTWTIHPLEVQLPEAPELIYNGEEQTALTDEGYYQFSDAITGVDAGAYTATVSLNDENCVWPDGTTEPKQITWTMKPAVIDSSTIVNTGLAYNGSPQTGVKSGAGYAITAGRATATAAGTYTATIELVDPANYIWEDGTTDAKTVTWSITGESYDMSGVTFPDATFTYDGEEHGIFIQGELPEGVSVSYEGNIEREPGVYEATAHFSGDTATHENPADMTATLTIEKLRVTVPTVSETFVFDGAPKLGPTAPDDTLYTLEAAPHTDAGVYTATARLTDPVHYCWAYDEPTSEDQQVRWVISPADVYDIEVEPIGNQFYTGEAIEPALTLRLGEEELVEGEDFTVTYADNTELGIAKATIEGKGNYAGVRDLYFSIINEPAEDEVTVTFDSGDGSPVLTQVISRGSVTEKPDDPELAGFYFRGWLLDGEKYDFASPVQKDIVLTAEWLDKLPNYTVSFDSAGGTAVEPQTVTEGECATTPADPTRELYVFDGWLLDGDPYDFTQPVMGDLELVASWEHAPGSVSIADASVTCSGGPFVYDGLAKMPSVGVTLDGKQLTETTDYIVSVINNVNAGRASVVITGTGIYTGTKVATFEIAQKQIDASAKLGGLEAQVYSGFALKPDLSVTVGGKLLKEDVDYTVTCKNNVNVGTASVTVTGKGNYAGTKSATFSIKPVSLSEAMIQPIPDQTYTGKRVEPIPTLTFNGKTLVNGTDYVYGYSENLNVGNAEVIVDGIGNFTGTIGKSFKIVEKTIAWKRLAGRGRYDTMAAIVEEGWSGQTGGTVVVATGADFKDALAAAGLAGLYDAPVVLTNGKDSKLSPQAARELKALRPSQVFVAGGPAAVSDGVLSSIRSTTGVTPVRLYGKSSASTSAALALKGKGLWGDTAIIATNRSFKDALSAAPLSYAKHWPILLASNGMALNADVLSALRSCGIRKVYIVGGTAAVTPAVEQQLKGAGITVAGRLAGKSGVQTSRAIADFAIKNGLSVANMAYATSQAFPDALGGAAFCGKNKSVLLLCDDRAQYNLSFATQKKGGIKQGYVFGGSAVFSDGLMARLPK